MHFFTASASRLRIILSTLFGLVIVLIIALAIIGTNILSGFADSVGSVVAQANSSDDNISSINRQITEYKNNSEAAKLASEIVAQRASYQYQNDAFIDLQSIAVKAGVTIARYSFSDSATGTSSSSAKSSSSKSSSTTSSPTNGVQPTYITITLNNPVNYQNYLNFIHYIEQSLTKMQIENISISSGNNDPNYITTTSLTIKVYTR